MKPYILAILALLTVMFALVYFLEPAFACESDTGSSSESSEADTDSRDAGATPDTQSATSSDATSDADNNRVERRPAIDCNDPFWWGFILCEPKRELP
jgi:hypothetical protein